MASKQKRQALFLGVCIPLRVFLAWVVYRSLRSKFRHAVTAALFLGAAGFAYMSAFGGPRGGFGGERYWSSGAHSALYLCAAVAHALGSVAAPAILLVDVLLGLATFARHYL